MTQLLTAAQMRAIERAAMDTGKATGLDLMERAGAGVVEAIFEHWPDLASGNRSAVIFCGPGNNGGDGFVVARMLRERNWTIRVFLFGDPEKLPPDARVNHDRWCKMGTVRNDTHLTDSYREEHSFDLGIDAIFGTGLTRPLAGPALEFCKMANHVGIDVCIDLPSGFCADSGRALVDMPGSEPWGPGRDPLTVTFQTSKIGHYLGPLASSVGKVVCKDIGLAGFLPVSGDPGVAGLAQPVDVIKRGLGHKYDHGHALVLSGPPGKGGAARLAARGALRVGAGLVTIGCPEQAIAENAAQLNAIMLTSVEQGEDMANLLGDARINALCLGPGLGLGERATKLVETALANNEKGAGCPATVFDADALTILARDPDLLYRIGPNTVLTPHAGEFARLFPDIAEKLDAPAMIGPAYSRVDATRDAAARAGCAVLFKGADTVIATPRGDALISPAHFDRSAPWLATAGSGDVLAGFIAGLLARGLTPLQAAATASWLHVECALNFGPGLIAEDLPEQLPFVFRKLSC